MPANRVVYDLTSLAKWFGPPVGITRVDRELALWAHRYLPDTAFVIFDAAGLAFREIHPARVKDIIEGNIIIEFPRASDAPTGERAPTGSLGRFVRRTAGTIRPLRRTLLRRLEARRAKAGSEKAKALIRLANSLLMNKKYDSFLKKPDGTLRPWLDLSAVTVAFSFSGRDIFFSAGSGWSHGSVTQLHELKRRHSFRFTMLLHDIIPLQFPEFYKPRDVVAFRDYFHAALPVCDLAVFSSNRTKADVENYCRQHGIEIGKTATASFGGNFVPVKPSEAELPAPLIAGKYALFVSTIEPRKGHRMLYNVWRDLLRDGIPQRSDFKLVFIGRPGWLMDDFLEQLKKSSNTSATLIHFDNVTDDVLGTLYRDAAFCLYPSIYEGFGLPVIESFLHGKAVIASTGGALPEVAGEFSPCIDPADRNAWRELIGKWIMSPAARAPYEQAIKERYRPRSWHDASGEIFDLIKVQ